MNKTDPIESTRSTVEASETQKTDLSPANHAGLPWSTSALQQAADQAAVVAEEGVQVIAQYSREIHHTAGAPSPLNGARLAEDSPFIGKCSSVKQIFALIEKVADTDSTVLILGESGTGKELVARALHSFSSRRMRPFVPVNCGAIPSELLESELFGHVKGAYTGAHNSRVGRFTLADKGTLFLDEIGTMPASLQVKILRALQNKEFEPVGANKTLKSDCRVIAATNIDLEQEVLKGNFREDLYYRLNVIPLNLPTLRDRREDIPLLVNHFIAQFNQKKGYRIEGVSDESMDILMRYNWPGNVRELENICQRVCILKGEGKIEAEDLPGKIKSLAPVSGGRKLPWTNWLSEGIPEDGIPFDELVADFENDLILKALEQTRWNKNKAAQLLRLNRTTLVEKIKKRGLNPT